MSDCQDRLAFRKADADFRAEIARVSTGEPGDDAALARLTELSKARDEAWDAYIHCVQSGGRRASF